MKISACVVVRNDLLFLRCSLPYIARWADQICVFDCASSDGTREFCQLQDVRYERADDNLLVTEGSDVAWNRAAALAVNDWVFALDADLIPHWNDIGNLFDAYMRHIRPVSSKNDAMALLMPLFDLAPEASCLAEHQWELAIERYLPKDPVLSTVKLYNRRVAQMRGYIHCEPYAGESAVKSVMVDVRLIHFAELRKERTLKNARYAWMMRRAMREPALQKWTNRWWWDVYCPEHEAHLEALALEYEKIGVGA